MVAAPTMVEKRLKLDKNRASKPISSQCTEFLGTSPIPGLHLIDSLAAIPLNFIASPKISKKSAGSPSIFS